MNLDSTVRTIPLNGPQALAARRELRARIERFYLQARKYGWPPRDAFELAFIDVIGVTPKVGVL